MGQLSNEILLLVLTTIIAGSAQAAEICVDLFKKVVPKLSISYPDNSLYIRRMDTANYTYEALLKLKNGTPEQKVEFIRIREDFLAQERAVELSKANNLFMEVPGSTRTIPETALTTQLYRSIKNDANFSKILQAMHEVENWEKDPNAPAVVRKAIVLSKFSQINMQKKYSSDSLLRDYGRAEGATRNSFEYTTFSEVQNELSLLSRKDRLKLRKRIFSNPQNIIAIKSSISKSDEGLQLHKILSSSPETFLAGIAAKVIVLETSEYLGPNNYMISPKLVKAENLEVAESMYKGMGRKASIFILANKLNIEDYRGQKFYNIDTFYNTIIHLLAAEKEFGLLEKIVQMTLVRNDPRDQRLILVGAIETTSMHYFRRAVQRSILDLAAYLRLDDAAEVHLKNTDPVLAKQIQENHIAFLEALLRAGVDFSDLKVFLKSGSVLASKLEDIRDSSFEVPMNKFATLFELKYLADFLNRNNLN